MSQNTSHAVMAQRREPSEEWRRCPSYPGYSASSLGRIRGPRGWVLSLYRREDGYLSLKVCIRGQVSFALAHCLVCDAFHGPSPSIDHEVAHGDGVRSNNTPGNLRWATRGENREDMRLHGTWPSLDQHPRAGLSHAQALQIRSDHAEARQGRVYVKRGERVRLALKFGVSLHVIKDIISNRSWRDEGRQR